MEISRDLESPLFCQHFRPRYENILSPLHQRNRCDLGIGKYNLYPKISFWCSKKLWFVNGTV